MSGPEDKHYEPWTYHLHLPDGPQRALHQKCEEFGLSKSVEGQFALIMAGAILGAVYDWTAEEQMRLKLEYENLRILVQKKNRGE